MKARVGCIDCDAIGHYPNGAMCLSCWGSGRVSEGDGFEVLIDDDTPVIDEEQVEVVALALLHATCRHYGDSIPEKPDLSLPRILARAAIDAIKKQAAIKGDDNAIPS